MKTKKVAIHQSAIVQLDVERCFIINVPEDWTLEQVEEYCDRTEIDDTEALAWVDKDATGQSWTGFLPIEIMSSADLPQHIEGSEKLPVVKVEAQDQAE